MLGHFVDASWAYRFGRPAHDAIVVTLSRDRPDAASEIISQAFRFPAGRPLRQESVDDLGLQATLDSRSTDTLELVLSSQRLVYGLRVHATGYRLSDDALTLEPGVARSVLLVAENNADHASPFISLTALNLEGQLRVEDR